MVRWVRAHLSALERPPLAIFTDEPHTVHFATGQPVHPLPKLSRIRALRENPRSGYFVLVISSVDFPLMTEEHGPASYDRELDRYAASVWRGENFRVWCISTTPPVSDSERHAAGSPSTCQTLFEREPSDTR